SAVFALHRRNDLFPASPGSTRVGCMGHCRRSRASGRSASRAAIADTVAVAGFGIHADADECRRRRRAVPPPGWLAARAGTGRGAPAPVEPRAIAAAHAGSFPVAGGCAGRTNGPPPDTGCVDRLEFRAAVRARTGTAVRPG